jgi:hypothetical protein
VTRDFIFNVWAPREGRWSPWVKPVLFACLREQPAVAQNEEFSWDTNWAPAPADGVALVFDLPGAWGVHAGMALASRGYRPIPLYNAIPAPNLTHEIIKPEDVVVDIPPILAALWAATNRLMELPLPAEAPPVFLLDWNRRRGRFAPTDGRFDNRSVSFTTDFPSANCLLAHGIQRVVLIHPGPAPEQIPFGVGLGRGVKDDQPQSDLAHTLRRWQDGGIALEVRRFHDPFVAAPLAVRKPSLFGWLCQRAMVALRFRRNDTGGFGAWIPDSAAG